MVGVQPQRAFAPPHAQVSLVAPAEAVQESNRGRGVAHLAAREQAAPHLQVRGEGIANSYLHRAGRKRGRDIVCDGLDLLAAIGLLRSNSNLYTLAGPDLVVRQPAPHQIAVAVDGPRLNCQIYRLDFEPVMACFQQVCQRNSRGQRGHLAHATAPSVDIV